MPLTGKRPDISELLDFEFYQLVWMYTEGKDLAKPNRELARWLGIARIVGGDMTYWVLPKSCRPVAESTVQHVTVSDMDEPDMKERVEKFNRDMREKIARNTQLVPKTDDPAEDSGHMARLESTVRPSDTLSEVLREEIR